MYNLKAVGLKIKEIRKNKKISQEKLAELVSMNIKSIIRLENAQGSPSVETLFRISEALEVKITDLFENQEFKNRTEIICDINDCINLMDDAELKKFYKTVYYYMH